ncbi:MAG TPA: FIST N-terminal domain-containing protein, partial [Gemmatimonadaceae bacterium]|nr:FIST N-terminal domain-containing protein [Gemmatimonadaceae bacterium]
MTDVAIAQTDLLDREAGEALGRQIREQLAAPPDALIIFASPRNDFPVLLEALAEAAGTRTIVGCSSAGEFTNEDSGVGLTNVTAIRSETMRFSASVGTGLSRDQRAAAAQIVSGFAWREQRVLPFRAALVLVDALAGHAEELVEALTIETGGAYRFFGGGAGDDARFQSTRVFCGTGVYANAVVALEIASAKPLGIGARHGWVPASDPLRVTAADASQMVSLNAAPAVEAFEEHAESTTQRFDRAQPMPFFLHNIVGVETSSGHKLRVPLGITEAGGIVCAAEVPPGATARIMSAGTTSAAEAAASAARDAVAQVTRDGGRPRAALFFDCVATRLRLGKDFDHELEALAGELGGAPFAGFNSYGQIVRADGQFSGFHNC